jgi:predicted RNase H-like HicB family nuclease
MMQINAIIEHDQNGYFAYVPSLKGCVSQGDSLEVVLKNIKEAIELYLEDIGEIERNAITKKSCIIAPIDVSEVHV